MEVPIRLRPGGTFRAGKFPQIPCSSEASPPVSEDECAGLPPTSLSASGYSGMKGLETAVCACYSVRLGQ